MMRIMHMKRRVLFVVVLALAGAAAVADIMMTLAGPSADAPTDQRAGIVEQKNPLPIPGLKTYVNRTYHFSLGVLQDVVVQEFKEEGTVLTVIFTAPGGDGFQVFVVPYGEPKITQERFKIDAPSGIMRDPADLKIDGVPATAFYGKSAVLGDTYEVWFIAHGFLYEVTTYADLEGWLSGVVKTWKFI
jgi:hypothetical protein